MSRTNRSAYRTHSPAPYKRSECKVVSGEDGLGEVDAQHLRVTLAELQGYIEFCGGLEPEPLDEWDEIEETINAAEGLGFTYFEYVMRKVGLR